VLNWFAWPGYTSTLAEPRLCGVFSHSSAATSRTAARRISRTKASQGFQIISWRWLCVSAIREPRPTGLRPGQPRKRGALHGASQGPVTHITF
jgi:hypothetical protein